MAALLTAEESYKKTAVTEIQFKWERVAEESYKTAVTVIQFKWERVG